MPLYHLTFGRTIPREGGNDFVTDLDWQMFCEEVLDSHFDGYMITDANGCWKSQHELTKTVSIDTDSRLAINDVVQEYKEMFGQDAVGLYITPSMEFI
jgi:hypothetical protein|tara:strand:+ start:51 stop:344 length:294 start_codon:yes stop_codon:yes gene_type:complete